MADAKYFGRKYILTLSEPGGSNKMTFQTEAGKPAMDIKFDVSYARGQTAREGTISILGLSRDTMTKYLMLAGMTRGKAMSHLMRVSLEAGYFTSAGMVNILNGFVWYCSVSSPPNMWLHMKVSEYNPLGARAIALGNPSGGTIREFIGSILAQYEPVEGVTFEIDDRTEDQILDMSKTWNQPFPSSTTLADAISIINAQLSDKVQFMLNSDSDDVRTLVAYDKQTEKAAIGEVTIDGDNGLLSVTGIDAVNGCITTFLDGTVKEELTHLNLESKLNPQANGRYYICKKQFVGHFLGQEWYSRYFCTAKEGDSELEQANLEIEA